MSSPKSNKRPVEHVDGVATEGDAKRLLLEEPSNWYLSDSISPKIVLLYPTVRSADDVAGIKHDLAELGFSVIGDILDAAEMAQFETSFWRAASSRVPKLKREDPASWTPENCTWKGHGGAGQFKYYGMAQEEHCWQIRKNRKIRRIYETAVYEDEECCVSLDGAAALFHSSESGLKLHVDLVPELPGFEIGSMQGSYNVYGVHIDNDSHKAGAGFVCVPGSHKLFDSIWEVRHNLPDYKTPKKHFFPLEEDSPLQRDTALVVNPANSLIIWDSKLLHRNYGGDFNHTDLGRICRLAQFITWHPKKFRSSKSLEKKIKMVLEGKSGNHWASEAMVQQVKPFPPWGHHPVKIIIPFKDCATLPSDILETL